jgi:hypothetical protein
MRVLKKHLFKYVSIYLAIGFVLVCVYNFPYYFSDREIGGWDTIGHAQLAKVYAIGFREFSSLIWDEGWFCGFPAFYYYPPFFYFIVTIFFISLPLSFTTAFNLGIFSIILILSYSIYRLFQTFASTNMNRLYNILFSYLAILFYLAYSGDGLQGTSVVGIWEGTFISSLGHAFMILSLCDLEQYRKDKQLTYLIRFVFMSTLLIYTHFLTSFFWAMAVCIHFLFFFSFYRQKLLPFMGALLAIVMLSSVSWYNYFYYSQYTSGVFYDYSFPTLLSILGKDIYDQALFAYTNGESFAINYFSLLLISGRIISVFAILGFLYEIRNSLKKNDGKGYLAIISLTFLWLSLDNTLGFILPGVKIHNYRAFDTFFLSFSVLMSVGLYHIVIPFKKYVNIRWLSVFVLLFALRNFLYLNPPQKEGKSSPYLNEAIPLDEIENFKQIETRLSKLPTNTLVFPEITKDRLHYTSPHFWSYLLRKYNLRNALGLTVESTLYSTLAFNWEQVGLQHTFRWGTEVDWSQLFMGQSTHANIDTQLPAFLQRSGIEYIVGHTENFRKFIYSRKSSFAEIEEYGPFMLAKVFPNLKYDRLPIGFVSDQWIHHSLPISPANFLRESNAVIANLHENEIPLRVINLETKSISLDPSLANKFSFILLYVNRNYLKESYGLAQMISSYGLPVVLLNAPAPSHNSMIWDWDPTLYKKLRERLGKTSSLNTKWTFTTTSYFPELIESSGKTLFHSDSNQIALYDSIGNLNVDLPKTRGRVLSLLMILVPIAYLLLSFKTKIR